MSISLRDGEPILLFSHLHGERELLVSLAHEEQVESRQNRWLDYILIDVKTPKDILYYLDSHVK